MAEERTPEQLEQDAIEDKIAGQTVATKKDKNSNDCETNPGNSWAGNIIPTNKLLEKSGKGNKRNPEINPIIIEI